MYAILNLRILKVGGKSQALLARVGHGIAGKDQHTDFLKSVQGLKKILGKEEPRRTLPLRADRRVPQAVSYRPR
jgi:hypothetical protein